MEFWGVEVKAGQSLVVKPELGSLIHISQAALGEGKKEKGNDFVPLRVKINGKKFVVGSLCAEKFPQVTFDLVFEKEFELSHDWKNGSVYFCGYSADNPYEDEEDLGPEDSDEDEDIPLHITENGKIESKAKPAASKGKTVKTESSDKVKVTIVEPKKDDESDEDDELDEDEDESDDDKDMIDDIGDSDDEDDSEDEDEDDSEDDDEETPKKADLSKKRPTESATKTPVPAKKAKLDTPQKTDGKKGGGHTATPYPSKQAGKTPVNSNKSPKSDGKVTCKSCTKTFNSDSALQSHSKAKHGGK